MFDIVDMDERLTDELLMLIRDSFISAFKKLHGVLCSKLEDIEADSWE